MKCSTKRLISILVCFAMALAILPVAAFAAGTTTVYCQAPDSWSNCNIHYWGGAETSWPGVEMSQDANGIWYFEVPNEATGLLFHNNAGIQTTDLIPPTDDKVMYVFENQYWTTYGKVNVVVEYYVAGSDTLCGVNWDPGAAQNKMTENGDGTYSLTYTGVAAGEYELKVTTGSWSTSWGEAGTTGNYKLSVADDDSTVVISFDPTTELVSAVINPEPVNPGTETLIAEGAATYATDADSWNNAESFEFVPAADGTVTVDITACTPGFYLDVYEDNEWYEEHFDSVPKQINIAVTAGSVYKFLLNSVMVHSPSMSEPKAGSVTYKITADVEAGEPSQGGGTPPSDEENSELNPLEIPSMYGCYIGAGKTMWFSYDNYEHMVQNGSYSQMLYISAGISYSVTYRGANVPVDAEGFVVYEMMDMTHQGTYLFSVTNNGSAEAFFSIEVKDRPTYAVSKYSLILGDNPLLPEPEYANTLYEFTPEQTGIYTFTISEGVLGDWGVIFNPVDKTENKSAQLQWTCTEVGQSVLVGVAETEEAVLTVTRTGDYVAEEQVAETVYENTYGFDYQLPANAELVPIDVLDDKRDEAILDKDGFYRYGSKNGPLMVADLNEFPINLEDAILNGQLRAYVYDSNGKLIARNNYNNAMTEYLEAGLVPVTQELATMLSQLGKHHSWWQEGGFIFEDKAPADEASAWMVACSYIKGSELKDDGASNGSGNTGTQGGSSSSGSSGSSGSNPKTADVSMAWAMLTMVLAGTALVVLKKKETFFLN